MRERGVGSGLAKEHFHRSQAEFIRHADTATGLGGEGVDKPLHPYFGSAGGFEVDVQFAVLGGPAYAEHLQLERFGFAVENEGGSDDVVFDVELIDLADALHLLIECLSQLVADEISHAGRGMRKGINSMPK